MDYSGLIQRIKELQRESGLSNLSFAEAINISPAALSHIYSGRNKPSLALITAIVEHFGITANELLYGDKPETLTLSSTTVQTNPESGDLDSINDLDATEKAVSEDHLKSVVSEEQNKVITSVITTFSDGTFKVYALP